MTSHEQDGRDEMAQLQLLSDSLLKSAFTVAFEGYQYQILAGTSEELQDSRALRKVTPARRRSYTQPNRAVERTLLQRTRRRNATDSVYCNKTRAMFIVYVPYLLGAAWGKRAPYAWME